MRTKVGGKKFNSLVIRFRRHGESLKPIFDIAIIKRESRSKTRYIEKVGFLNKKFTEHFLILNSQRVAYWATKGVKMNYSVKKKIAKFLV